ncbi:MAG: SDR family oxidoreductase [Ramlibacter sp.]
MPTHALEGRKALITGGTGGLGSAMALAFVREGAQVAICGSDRERTVARAQALAQTSEGRIEGVELDLRKAGAAEHAVRAAVDLLGGLDIVVCAAGAPADGRLENLKAAQWRDSFGVKFFGAVDVMTHALPFVRKSRNGVLVALSGVMGREPQPGNIVAGTINAALENFMKSLAAEVAPDGVRALTICPGPFETARIRNILEQRGRDTGRSYEDLFAASVAEVPLRRFGTAEEFGRFVAMIVSDMGSYITGTTITMDGGLRRGAF